MSASWQFWIDVGGTFTDCLARAPDGSLRSHKLLSTGTYQGELGRGSTTTRLYLERSAFPPRFLEGFQIVLHPEFSQAPLQAEILKDEDDQGLVLRHALPDAPPAGTPYVLSCGLPAPVVGIRYLLARPLKDPIGPISLRLGTTRGTNALLTRRGARVALLITKGFGDALAIGMQNRPRLFDLDIRKAAPFYEEVIEIAERLDAEGRTLQAPDPEPIDAALRALKTRGIESLAICLLHAYRNPAHEEQIAAMACKIGFDCISLSSSVAPLPRLVPRAETTVIDAYLTPVVHTYVDALRTAMPEADIKLMTSAGGLVSARTYRGKDSILSGPAGGVVGVARIAREVKADAVIGFDMGGTSTDVCRYGGTLEHRYEMELAGAKREGATRLLAPMLAIETVAAGGGSICDYDGTGLTVGPDSAGADPGPACYGRGGPLTITDCNLYLGRIERASFAFPLDLEATTARLKAMAARIYELGGTRYTLEELAAGFLAVAAQTMALPIKRLSVQRGYDVRAHALVSFGGAGAQHACHIAEVLGIRRIVLPTHASLLSAFGIGMADINRHAVRPLAARLTPQSLGEALLNARALAAELKDAMHRETPDLQVDPCVLRRLDLRYEGQDSLLTLDLDLGPGGKPRALDTPDTEVLARELAAAFTEMHQRSYGFAFDARAIEMRAIRVELVWSAAPPLAPPEPAPQHEPEPCRKTDVWLGGRRASVPVYQREQLKPGATFAGPALVVGANTVAVVESDWRATLGERHHLELHALAHPQEDTLKQAADPVRLALLQSRLSAIAEEMGAVLQRSALSVNVKERLDFSCALFTATGDLIVNAPHIPVHLGAMGDTVRAVLKAAGPELRPGDVYISNDPYRGGSHLPDVTAVAPVFARDGQRLLFFVANRAHHAEIGGLTPGSMPPMARCLAEEGVLIRPFRAVSGGVLREDELERLLTTGPYPSRQPQNNIADLKAQIAANILGSRELLTLVEREGERLVTGGAQQLIDAAANRMHAALARLPAGVYEKQDAMDDGTPVVVRVTVKHDAEGGKAVCDFTGTGPVSSANFNANPSIVKAATLYAFRCLINEEIPLNEGMLRPVQIVIPSPSLLSPPYGIDPTRLAAMNAGNVETSQRVVDILLGALGVAAASQGTMNNLLFGQSSENGRQGFGYYETIGGGAGAGPGFVGADAVQTHMTNTRITDAEILEERFPVRLLRFAIRRGSGGAGLYRGGDGMIRELEFLAPVTVSLITGRRLRAPFGLAGGADGAPGRNVLKRRGKNGTVLPPFAQVELEPGDRLLIETPGGGGYGRPD